METLKTTKLRVYQIEAENQAISAKSHVRAILQET
jgi:hypothetical protein